MKDLWALYITALDVKVTEMRAKKKDTPSEEDDADEADLEFEEDLSNDEDDAASVSSQSNVSTAYRSDMQVLKRYPIFIISPLFSYLAIVILRLPITLSDIFG